MDDAVSRLLRERALRVTPQRRAILGAFTGRPEEHLSADEVHARAVAAVPELGRGTVYATLAELTELGVLGAIGNPEPVRYETNVAPHQHFRCRLCLRIFDVTLDVPDTAALANEGYQVDGVLVVAEGICAPCHAYERGLRDGAADLGVTVQVSDALLSTLACVRHDSTIGPVLFAASARGIVRMAFEEHVDFARFAGRARRRGSAAALRQLDGAAAALDAYRDGDHRTAADVLDVDAVPLRSPEVLRATLRIDWGQTRSYERLGVPLAPYDSGYALGNNPMPILLPCHRVTRGAQRLGFYVGGLERLQALTAYEAA